MKTVYFLVVALESGCLAAILPLCSGVADTVALLVVRLLSMLLEDPATHPAIVEGKGEPLQNILRLANDENPQVC